MSAAVSRRLDQARRQLQSGDLDAAIALCEEVLRRAPRNPEALWLLGTAHLTRHEAAKAVPLFEHALATAPDHGPILESLGLAYLMREDYVQAERVLRKALSIRGAPISVRMRLGLALLHQGRSSEAIEELRAVAAAAPSDIDARLNLGRAYAAGRLWREAAREFETLVRERPQLPDALFNLGVAYTELGEPERARACFERLLDMDPAYVDAREMLASVHLALGRYREAIAQLRDVLRVRPTDGSLHAALAEASLQIGALDEALHAARAALTIGPDSAGAYSIVSLIQQLRGELGEAIATLETGYARTAAGSLLGALMHLTHRVCDWPKWDRAWRLLSPQLGTASDLGSPFWLLCEATTAAQQLSYTRRWAAERFGKISAATPPASRLRARGSDRLRIGYLSSDFQEHAVAHLMVEAVELHDRSRFEIYAYSYGPDDGSVMRARLRAGIEHFVDVAWEPDDAVVQRMRADDLDVLIDLRGYTAGERLQIMARRPAPVQVTWLGYPGTTGADFIDYLIADPYIIPPEAEMFYSERVLRMPVCYQPNDRKRDIAQPLTRAEYGLPEEDFVFCCFNQLVKVIPQVFARWMNLLHAVPRSVLWVLEDNAWARVNLQKAAAAQGVDPQRLVFAPHLPNPQHLARFRVADLALDTFPYTSHTTASDALWLGCPLVALCGETFAARVSGSILSGCGLEELVTHTLDDYEKLAHRLATDAPYLQAIHTRVAAARDSAPVFDSLKFARDLEALYLQIAVAK